MRLECTISKRIIAARKSRKWNQAQLAEASGVPPGTVSRYEKGTMGRIALGNLCKIADATGVTVDYLLGRCD